MLISFVESRTKRFSLGGNDYVEARVEQKGQATIRVHVKNTYWLPIGIREMVVPILLEAAQWAEDQEEWREEKNK